MCMLFPASAHAADEDVSGEKTFSDEKLGINFQYPGIWEVQPNRTPDDVFVAQAPGGFSGVYIFVNKTMEHTQASLDALAEVLPEQIKADPASKFVSIERPQICSCKAVRLKFEINNPTAKMHSQTVIVLTKNVLVNFNFFTVDMVAQYDTPVIERIISTINCDNSK